jgi:hypothetical protein
MPTLRRGRYNKVQGKANAGRAGYILIWQKCLSQVLGDHNVFEWSKRKIGSSHDQGEERLSFARLGRLPLGGLVIIATYYLLLAVPKYLCFFFSRDRGALSKSLASALQRPGGRGMASTSLKLTRVSPHLLLLHSTTMIGKNKAEAEFYHHCTTPKPEQRRPGIDVLLASHILPVFLLSHTEPSPYRRRCKQQVQEAQKIKPLSANQHDVSHRDQLPD